MEIKRLISHFTYRIEPKPEGGFVAHASDAGLPALEAPTREELQQKIQTNISASLTKEFPELNLPALSLGTKFAFHVEHKPDGGFAIHSNDPNAPTVEDATHHEIESKFVEKLIGAVGQPLMKDMVQALIAKGGTGDVNVSVLRTGFTTTYKTNKTSTEFSLTGMTSADPNSSMQIAKTTDGNMGASLDASPITPEVNSFGKILRFVLALLALSGLMYFYLHRH